MSVATCSTVVGVFHELSEAVRAIDDLVTAGFRNDQIAVVTRDPEGRSVVKNKGEAETQTGTGAVAGAIAGAGVGGIVGLGVLAGVIPVIGSAIAAGTLATILTNATGGAAIGALIGRGVPEEHSKYYDGEFRAGRVVVTVEANDRCDLARTILDNHGGYDHESGVTSSARV
jgi:hypothetical protein